jgi:hypothetical protein
MSETALWPRLREALAGDLSAEARPWLDTIRGAGNGADGRLVLTVATQTAERWIEHQYTAVILAAARRLGHAATSLDFHVLELQESSAPPPAASTDAPGDSVAAPESEFFARVPLSILCDPQVSANAKVTWAAIATFAGYAKIYATEGTLAARGGLSVRSIRRGLRELEGAGYLAMEGKNGGRAHKNLYSLFPGKKAGQPGRVCAENPARLSGNPAKSGEKPGQVGR